MSTKLGRKPLHEKKKDRKITISFTAAEADAFSRDANHLDRTLAEYLRDRISGNRLVVVPSANTQAWVLLAEVSELLKPLLRALEASSERGPLTPRLVLGVFPMIDRLQDALVSAATALDRDKEILDFDSGLSGY